MKKTITTGVKTFDRLLAKDFLGTGNVFSNLQTSSFIRSKQQTECNGFSFPLGKLRDNDIQTHFPTLPQRIKQRVLAITETDPIILYRFFHRRGKKRIEHGYIATYTADRNYALIGIWVTGCRYTSRQILVAIAPAISNKEDYPSIGIKDYLLLDPAQRQTSIYLFESGDENSGKEVVGFKFFCGAQELQASEATDHFLTGENRLQAVFADGTSAEIHYGYRLKVVQRGGDRQAA